MTDGTWPGETENGYIYYICFCQNDIYRIFWYALSTSKLIYLIALLFLARGTRKVWQTHRESFELTLQGYTSILFCMLMVVLRYMQTQWEFRISIGAFIL